ncbi:hypothetical protein NDN08_007591 [Rhodosorus marinus]|uniref:MsrB domain-containing protein n=1 Tax=Rhodosorus marinus TaxID=101924 RepID=A0AAV8UZ77_9RHOD|nr:hypothetical protein NDN08_007591 [Rhodosorus marinus]
MEEQELTLKGDEEAVVTTKREKSSVSFFSRREEPSVTFSQNLSSSIPKRKMSRLDQCEIGEFGMNGSFVDRAFSNDRKSSRTVAAWRKSDVVPWAMDNDIDLSNSFIQRQESFLDRIRRLKIGGAGDENDSPLEFNASRSSSKFRTHSKLKRARRKPLRFDTEDMLTEEQAQKIGFVYGDELLDVGFSVRRKAVQHVKNYIAEIRVPESEQAWPLILSSADVKCLREKTMEPPGSGEYTNFAKLRDLYGRDGIFRCRGCRSFLFLPGDFIEEGYPWATFRSALPGALVRAKVTQENGLSSCFLCQKCGCFIGRSNHMGGTFVCSRSIHYHPMSKDEEDLIFRACKKRKQKLDARK